MGTYTITKWRCDCCGAEYDKRPQHDGSTRFSLRVDEDYGTAGGPTVVWKELCPDCNRRFGVEIGKFINAVKGKSA